MRWKVLRPSMWNLLDVSIVGLVLPDRQLQFFGHSDQHGQGSGAHLFHNLTTLDLYRDFAGAKFGSDLLVEQAGGKCCNFENGDGGGPERNWAARSQAARSNSWSMN